MNYTGISLCMALVVAVGVSPLLTACTDTSALTAPPSVYVGVPPAELQFSDPTYRDYPADLEAKLTFDTEGKTFLLRWRHGSGAWLDQSVALASYPTAAIFTDGGDVCVGGKRRSGATTVDVFEVTPPTSVVDANTGKVTLVSPGLSSIENVFEEKSVGKDMVRLMFGSQGSPDEIFMQFWDSMDLYRLDLNSSAHFIEASPTLQAGVIHATGLSGRYSLVREYDHITQGHLYVFSGVTDSSPILVFSDSNRDGVLDAEFELTAHQWASQGYQDASSYNL